MSDAGMARLLAEIEQDAARDCKRCREYPAVLGGLCGLCRGKEMASRSAAQAFKAESEKPRSTRRLLT